MFKSLKKCVFSLLAILIAVSCLVRVEAITCNSIDIHVYLQPNGDAYIEEVWDMYIDEGTEVYKDESYLNDCEILDLRVKDDKGNVFTTFDRWDTSLSFEQKKYKCGLNKTSSGYEICWGVSQYGRNRYTVSYTMTNFINSYEDYDGFNQRLVNDKMSNPPKKISITISADSVKFSDQNTKYQGMGFKGDVILYSDYLYATSSKSLSSKNHATILMRFDKGMFSPTNKVDKTYAEVEKEANERGKLNLFEMIAPIAIVGGGAALLFIFIYTARFYASSRKVKKYHVSKRDVNYYRDIPFDGNLIPAYFSLIQISELKNETDIIGAYLLRWMLNKNIRIEVAEKPGLFRSKQQPSIIFENNLGIDHYLEKQLYEMLYKASGRDHILQEDEFERWAKNNYEDVESWLESIKLNGENYFTDKGFISTYTKRGLFHLIKAKQRYINDMGKTKVEEVLGLKFYLKEFTLVNEREAREVYLWKDYLIYASLYGIASEVSRQFEELYPKYFEEYIPYYSNPYATIMMINHMNYSLHQGYSAGFQSSQSTSFSGGGGGGGFSGGGSGGGVR